MAKLLLRWVTAYVYTAWIAMTLVNVSNNLHHAHRRKTKSATTDANQRLLDRPTKVAIPGRMRIAFGEYMRARVHRLACKAVQGRTKSLDCLGSL